MTLLAAFNNLGVHAVPAGRKVMPRRGAAVEEAVACQQPVTNGCDDRGAGLQARGRPPVYMRKVYCSFADVLWNVET